MKKLTKEDIDKINKNHDSWNQGIYKEPFGVDHEKDYVIYQRHETGGVSGGSCWDESNPQPYENWKDREKWIALEMALKIINPSLTYSQFTEIENLVTSSTETEWEYYGNCQHYDIWYLSLEKLYKFLNIN